MNAHPLFPRSFARFPFDGINRLLSNGAASYYVRRGGVETRLIVHDYFSLLAGRPVGARWRLTVYGPDGRKGPSASGELAPGATETIPLSPLVDGLGEAGLCWLHLSPAGFVGRRNFLTIYFAEYARPGASAVLHSMGHPVPKAHVARDYVVASLEEGAGLLLANARHRFFPSRGAAAPVVVEVESGGAHRRTEVALPPPLGCRWIPLQEFWPAGKTEGPALVRVTGPDVLYSPVLWRDGSSGMTAEHFQALDWEAA